MKVFLMGIVLSLGIVFSIACGTKDEGAPASNTNKPANTNTSQPAPAASANANESAPAANANKAASDAKPAANADGAALFAAQKCVTCHGPDGKGKLKGVPDFTDAAWQKRENDASLAEGIKKGKPPKMPAFESKLSDAEVKALVAHVRTFAGK